MRKYSIMALIIIPMLINSCATILNGGNQEIKVSSTDPQSTIYLNGDSVGTGTVDNLLVPRDFESQQIEINTKGYHTDYHVLLQEKRASMYTLSWIPFGIFIVPPIYDNGAKAYDYQSTYSFKPRTPKLEWDESLKRIHLDKVSVDLSSENHEAYIVNYSDFRNNKRSYIDLFELDSIQLEDTYYSRMLFKKLKENGFVDTNNVIFQENHNVYKLRADVKELYFYDVRKSILRLGFISAWSKIAWEIKDVYDQTVHVDTVEVMSGEFSPDYISVESAIDKALEDVIERSMYEFLLTDKARKLIDRDERTNIVYDEKIKIDAPTSKITTLDDAMKAAVTIKDDEGHGSGFFISNDGYLLTNYHVIAGKEDKIEILLNDGRKAKPKIIRTNEIYDLALLKIDEEVEYAYDLPTQKRFSTGDDIFAIGTPTSVELGQSISKGIISSVREYKNYDWIQTDVSLNPGNSGGTIVNSTGELIGVVDFKVMGFGFEGLSFCIPAYNIQKILDVSYN